MSDLHIPDGVLDAMVHMRSALGKDVLQIPQLVVVGDQSAGKSSTLRNFGAELETDSALCTRHPTRIYIKRGAEKKVEVSINPDPRRPVQEQATMRAFQQVSNNTDRLREVLGEARKTMGLNNTDRRFCADTVNVVFTNPGTQSVIFVDLPGLFQTAAEGQTEEDAEIVQRLAADYIASTQTIILLVISAEVSPAGQSAVKFVKKYDPDGSRTMVIVTKPDRVRPEENPSNFKQYIDILSGKADPATFFPAAHGWFVLRNQLQNEQHYSLEDRDESERRFFAESAWKVVPSHVAGIDALMTKVRKLQMASVLASLPLMIDVVKERIGDCEDILQQGSNDADIRTLEKRLALISTDFTAALQKAVRDRYVGSDQTFRGALQIRCRQFETDIAAAVNDASDDTALRDCIDKYLEYSESMPGQFSSRAASDVFYDCASPWPQLVVKFASDVRAAVKDLISKVLESLELDAPFVERFHDMVTQPVLEHVFESVKSLGHPVLRGFVNGEEIDFTPQQIEIDRGRGQVIRDMFIACVSSKGPRTCDPENLKEYLVKKVQDGAIEFAVAQTIPVVRARLYTEMSELVKALRFEHVFRCFKERLEDMFSQKFVVSFGDSQVQRLMSAVEDQLAKENLARQDLETMRAALQELEAFRKSIPRM